MEIVAQGDLLFITTVSGVLWVQEGFAIGFLFKRVAVASIYILVIAVIGISVYILAFLLVDVASKRRLTSSEDLSSWSTKAAFGISFLDVTVN